MSATARIGFRASATATVIRFHERIADGADYIVRNAANEDDTGSFAAVVAICGTACEMALRYAFSSFVNQNPNPPAPAACAAVTELLNSTRQVHLRDKSGKQLQLWTDTTRDDIAANWADWTTYLRFYTVRNNVVHRGTVDGTNPSTRADALDALRVTHSLHAHIKTVMRADAGVAPMA